MADTHPPQPHKSPMGMLSNVLAIAGFCILVVIILWGLFHIASLSSGWLSSFFPSDRDEITITVPERARTGEPVRLSWKYESDEAGRYAFLYDCREGTEFGIPIIKQGETRAQLARVTCGEVFPLGSATSSVIIVPVLATSSAQTAHLSVFFTPTDGGSDAQGSASMVIEPATVAPTTTPQKPTTKQPEPKPAAPASSGPADLAITILSATTDATGLSVVSFDIRNTGGTPTGAYSFYAYLPTAQPYTFYSDPQASLAPGAHIVNTLRFSQSVSGALTVAVDPSNTVRESNESNNSASQQINAPYNSYNSYDSYAPYDSYSYPVYQY